MRLLIFSVSSVFLADEKCQIVLVDHLLLIVEILPNETALLTILRNRLLSKLFPVLVHGVEIKDKDSVRIKVIIRKSDNLNEILVLHQIIHRIADAHNRVNRSVKLKLSHILFQIQNSSRLLCLLLNRDLKHFLGQIHTDHIITIIR